MPGSGVASQGGAVQHQQSSQEGLGAGCLYSCRCLCNTSLVLYPSDFLALMPHNFFFSFFGSILLPCTTRKGLSNLFPFTARAGVLSWRALAWLLSLLEAHRTVLMLRQPPAPSSLFLALTACCSGKATFKQNIPLWDDSGTGEGMNEWVFCCLHRSTFSSCPWSSEKGLDPSAEVH